MKEVSLDVAQTRPVLREFLRTKLPRDNWDVPGIPKAVTNLPPIGILGTGRMAKALGALLSPIGAVAGRCAESAANAAKFIDLHPDPHQAAAPRTVSLSQLPRHSRHILIAVSDDAIPEVAAALAAAGLSGAIVLHTSGAAGPEALDALRAADNSVGVLHPLQTVPSAERGVQTLRGATYAFAGDRSAAAWAQDLIAQLEGKPLAVDPRHWQHYHAAAVMACNYQVTLVDAALELMEIAAIGRAAALDALGPILRATIDNVLGSGPEKALTGPIRRGDVGTVRRHLAALDIAAPETRRLYSAAGLRTVAIAERAGLQENAARQLRQALGMQD
jgi:predicted short-subunit dehydrogenase-like oxidoreductase (DUF2520 family)